MNPLQRTISLHGNGKSTIKEEQIELYNYISINNNIQRKCNCIVEKGLNKMNISELKEYIYNNKKVKFVLENIGNHNIIYHSSSGLLNPWFTCSNFDGDNTNAIKVEDTKYLNVTNYTRPEFNKLGKG